MSTETLIAHSRCPHGAEAGRACSHPNKLAVLGKPVLIPELELMRRSLIFEDADGHSWTVVWHTDQPQN